MDLSYHNRHAASAKRARKRLHLTGVTMRGDMVWTHDEDEVIRSLYPDYQAVFSAIPSRTERACRTRAITLGIARKKIPFTAKDLSVMRKFYPLSDRDELLALFPGRTWDSICSFARRNGIFRTPKPYKATGIAVLDQIRSRCRELNYTMPDLDKLARCKAYFARADWHTGHVHHRAIGRAVSALFGDLKADWK